MVKSAIRLSITTVDLNQVYAYKKKLVECKKFPSHPSLKLRYKSIKFHCAELWNETFKEDIVN